MWDPFSVARATTDQVTEDPAETAPSNVETEPEPSGGAVGEPPVEGALVVDEPLGDCDIDVSETPSTAADEFSTDFPADSRADTSVSVFQVHPLVWRHAMDAADGDARRIEIIDETHVTVHNKRVR